jgi:hypothetical protein
MHFGRTGIGEAGIDAAIDQRLNQGLGTVHLTAPVMSRFANRPDAARMRSSRFASKSGSPHIAMDQFEVLQSSRITAWLIILVAAGALIAI